MSHGSAAKYIDFDFETDEGTGELLAKTKIDTSIKTHPCIRLYACKHGFFMDGREWCRVANESVWGKMFSEEGRCPLNVWFINRTPFEDWPD
jgi:hypothetical protein